jgi:hypothetical protein
MINEDDFWSNWWNEIWQGKPKYSEKTYPSATLQIRHGVIQNNRKNEQQTFNTSASGTTNVKNTPEVAIPPTIVLSPEDGHVGRNMSCDFKRL